MRNLILIGNGCRGNPVLIDYLCGLGIPVMTTWQGADLVADDCPAFVGRPGVLGMRYTNIIQECAERIFIFGARMDAEQVAHSYDNFAPNAKKFVLDVDKNELGKFPQTRSWVTFANDLSQKEIVTDFCILDRLLSTPFCDIDRSWMDRCRKMYEEWGDDLIHEELSKSQDKDLVNPYLFWKEISLYDKEDTIFALGSSSTAPNTFMQMYPIKKGQRVTNLNVFGPMGADIPMAVGVSLANPGKRVICVTGDGSFVLNMQELELVRRYKLPIIFFVFYNDGYGSIRNMQINNFGDKYGADKASGLSLPDISEIAEVYYMDGFPITRNKDFHLIPQILDSESPLINEVYINPNFQYNCKVASHKDDNGNLVSDPMWDMTPKMNSKELAEIMEWMRSK
jgi:acetolactate synthase-1/2/3 large subunit